MPTRRAHLFLVICFGALTSLLHLSAFWVPHKEGDEVVYVTLAREMHWDLSHYTTQDDPHVRDFPFTIYRQPLFHHPPAYPLILKVGLAMGNPVAAGVLASILAMWLLLHQASRLLQFLGTPLRWSLGAYAGIALGPILLYSTVRLHHDGLTGIFLACGLIATLEALERRSLGRAALAGLLWVVALNLRYSALLGLPLLIGAQAYFLHRCALKEAPGDWRAGLGKAIRGWRNWRVFLLILLAVATLGLQHFYRIALEYGTVLPWEFLRFDPNAPLVGKLQFYRLQRSRFEVLLVIVAIIPGLIILVTPWALRVVVEDLREGRWEPFLVLVFSFLFLGTLAFTHHMPRYFALATPFLYLIVPYLLRRSRDGPHRLVLGAAVLSLFLMTSTAINDTVRNPGREDIIPFISVFNLEEPREE